MNKKGFTLIELMVVVLIIAILAAIAIPFYNDAIDSQNNARAKAILEAINAGLERFDREYPRKLDFLSSAINTETDNNLIVIPNANNNNCYYNGQNIVASGQTTNDNISLENFIQQMIVCGYIPRANYGTDGIISDRSLDYRFRLQAKPVYNSSTNTFTGGICGNGYVYMEPKTDEYGKVKVGSKYCLQNTTTTQNEEGEAVSTSVCMYCAGITILGNATDLSKYND